MKSEFEQEFGQFVKCHNRGLAKTDYCLCESDDPKLIE